MKTNKVMAVPRLRFPDFKGGKGWKQKKLINLVDKDVKWSFIGGPFGSNLKSSDYTESGVRVIQLQNIGDGEFLGDYEIYTSESKADDLLANNIYPNEIIMSKMGDPVGRACLIPDTHPRYVMCSDGIRLVIDEKKHDKYFVYSLINSTAFRSSIESKSTGSTRKRIGLSHLKDLNVIIPTLQEQQKISDCLSSLDTLITSESEQLDALKSHKAGLLQQLFPADSETAPKLRFAEFEDDGDWETKQVNEIFKITRGNVLPMTQVVKTPFGDKFYPVYSSQTKDNGLAGYYSKYLYENAITWTTDGANAGDVNYREGRFYCTNVCGVLLNDEGYANVFMAEALNSVTKKHVSYVGNPKLMNGVMSKIKIPVPKLPEQQMIADCLSSLDNLVQSKNDKIEALKCHKQGLMQQLFPSNEDL